MIIVEDTRQQTTKHKNIEKHFQSINQPSVRSKLIVGDYTRLDNQTVSIDTKKDIVEISGNICGGQHERFRAECELAKKCGIQLIVLIEEVPPKGDLDNWQSPKTKSGKPLTMVKGSVLKKAMATMSERYGVRFEFITKDKTAQRIIEILSAI